MSIAIAIKYDKGVLLATDRQMTWGNMTFNNVVKVRKSQYSNTAIATLGSCREGDIIQAQLKEIVELSDILDKKKIDKNYIVEVIVPKIFNILERNGALTSSEGRKTSHSQFVIATPENIYGITETGCVIEQQDGYFTLGCGMQYVMGLMNSNNLENITYEQAKDIIIKGIKEACKGDPYIDDNIDFVNLEREEIKK